MNYTNILWTIYVSVAVTATVSYCMEEFARYVPDGGVADDSMFSHQSRSGRVKRKGGKGGGRSRGSSGRKSATKPKPRPAEPYPKQPPYNPSYNPSAPAYPKQPGQTGYPGPPNQHLPGYPGAGAGQHGQYPGAGAGQHGQYPGGYNQPGHGTNMGGMGMGTGLGAGMGTMGGYGMGKSKSGIGGLGAGAMGGVAGAALGAYGGYKLGRMVGGLGMGGHYGYYNDRHIYVKCDPPPRIETDPETNVTYIPKTVEYDARCSYYDQQPAHRSPYHNQGGWGVNGSDMRVTPGWNLLTFFVTILVFGFRCRNYRPIEWNFWSHLLLV